MVPKTLYDMEFPSTGTIRLPVVLLVVVFIRMLVPVVFTKEIVVLVSVR